MQQARPMFELQPSENLVGPTRSKPAFQPLDLRERALRYGIATLSDADLLALLLSTGSSGASVASIAQGLLAESGGLSGLTQLGTGGLAEHYGVGPAKAARLAAALELGKRAFREAVEEEHLVLTGVQDVARWARPRLSTLEHEEVWLLSLDGQNALKSARRVAQGGLHGCALTPKDVLRPALRAAASAIILLHNHPSGCAEPSAEDIEMTQQLSLASHTLGIALVDHVIVARRGACSLAELGVIP